MPRPAAARSGGSAGPRRASPPGRPRCRRRRGASGPSPASVSSSSQPARGSPSRGWPTLPGFTRTRSAPARARNGASSGKTLADPAPSRASTPSADGCGRRGRAASARMLEARPGDRRGQDVLPGRVARAAVDEDDPRLGRGCPAGPPASSPVPARSVPGPLDRGPRVVVEPVDVERAGRRPIVVAGDAAAPISGEAGDDAVRVRPVADDVAEVPDGVDVAGVGEDGIEGDEVGVDVRQHGDAHAIKAIARGMVAGEAGPRYQGRRFRAAGSRGHDGSIDVARPRHDDEPVVREVRDRRRRRRPGRPARPRRGPGIDRRDRPAGRAELVAARGSPARRRLPRDERRRRPDQQRERELDQLGQRAPAARATTAGAAAGPTATASRPDRDDLDDASELGRGHRPSRGTGPSWRPTRRASRRANGSVAASGRPGKPPPLPEVDESRRCPARRRTRRPVRLSTTWRIAISAGSRIAVRLIAAFQASSSRTWPSIVRRASSDSDSPIAARPASRARSYSAGRGGRLSTRVGSGSGGRSRHPSCRSCLCGPSGLRSRRRRTSHRARTLIFRCRSGSRPGLPVPLAGLGTQAVGADAGR